MSYVCQACHCHHLGKPIRHTIYRHSEIQHSTLVETVSESGKPFSREIKSTKQHKEPEREYLVCPGCYSVVKTTRTQQQFDQLLGKAKKQAETYQAIHQPMQPFTPPPPKRKRIKKG